MEPALNCLKISARIASRETYRMIPNSIHLFSHWSIPLNKNYSAFEEHSLNYEVQTVKIETADL
jgi:hypothetical protein